MKSLEPAAMTAIEAGEAIVTGAVSIVPWASDIFEDFVGLSWLLPNLNPGSPGNICYCPDDATDTFVIGGSPSVTYDLTLRIRGVIELITYSGGTSMGPSYAVRDPSGHSPPAVNLYRISVSSPAHDYYLNNGTFNISDITAVDYEITIPVNGGATITLFADSVDGGEVRNVGNHSATDDDAERPIVVSQPYDGQFMQADALTLIGGGIEVAGSPVRLWGGYGPLVIDGDTFQGIGARALAQQTAGAIGGIAQGTTLALSGVEPAALALLDADEVKGASVVLYRLIFGPDGKTLLDAHVFDRGRVDTIDTDETIGAEAAISLGVESAARGLGRNGGRRRADSDQRLIDPDDGYFKNTAYAGQKTLYWGGKRPSYSGQR